MTDQHERLLKFDDHKLMDVVKNYRQYGYDDTIRSAALSILEERGITVEHLQLTGNLENRNYNEARNLYASFRKNSLTAFVLYLAFLLLRVPVFLLLRNEAGTPITLVALAIGILYAVFFIMSFLNQYRFYQALGEDYGMGGILIYVVGFPLYLLVFFYLRADMKEKLSEIK